jgi:hypothetical protein
MDLNTQVIKAFANTIAELDAAIITKTEIDFYTFINEFDQVFWLATSEGDVVPAFYISMINQAFGDLSCNYKDKYLNAYHSAIQRFREEKTADEAIDIVTSADYIGHQAEQQYIDSEQMQYEAGMAYADYSKTTDLEIIADSRYLLSVNDELATLVVDNRCDFEGFYFCDTQGELVRWFLNIKGNYFSIVESRYLEPKQFMSKIKKSL